MTDIIRKQDDERVCPIIATNHELRVIRKHQSVEQKVAMVTARNCLSARSQTCRVFVEDLGLEHGNSVQTPATLDAEPLDQVQHGKYRWQVARCLFLSQDRADMTFIVNELSQRMSNPTQQRFAKLKRLVRSLVRERQWEQVFSYGRMVEEVTAVSE